METNTYTVRQPAMSCLFMPETVENKTCVIHENKNDVHILNKSQFVIILR